MDVAAKTDTDVTDAAKLFCQQSLLANDTVDINFEPDHRLTGESANPKHSARPSVLHC